MFQSIFLRITLLFLVTFAAMGAGFYALDKQLSHEHEERLQSEASALLLVLRKSVLMPPEMRRGFLRKEGYSIAEPHPDLIQTMKNAMSTIPDNYPEEIKDSLREGRIRILKDDRHLYVYLTRATPPLLVFKTDAAYRSTWPEMVFGSLLISLIVIYLLIIKTLFPLKTLIRTINRYGTEGIYRPIRSTDGDEIAMVANALDSAMAKNQSLIEARRLFLRNIMHELKTPITVGKLAMPFLKKSEEKAILERAFLRMEHLIQELVRVEQITSGALAPHRKECALGELIDKATELLYLKPESLDVIIDNTPMFADFDTMLTVVKNLIDNAVKYSPDGRVRIRQDRNEITFSNRGEPWPEGYTLEKLCEPFFHHQSESASFGLGLYLIQSVIEAHGFTLQHRYESGEHHFTIRYPLIEPDEP